MSEHWILDGHRVVPCDLMTWARWFERASRDGSRIVAQDRIGEFRVSTVFLGVDHRFLGDGPPLLFETMIFGPELSADLYQEHYSTWDEAEAGHAAAIAEANRLARAMTPPPAAGEGHQQEDGR